jgi:ribosomal protein L7/L12
MEIAVLFLAVFVLVLVSALDRKVTGVERRAARIERKTDLIMAHLGVEEPQPDLREVVGLLRAGKKIEAVKVYRRLTGAGLREAKEAVERIGGHGA